MNRIKKFFLSLKKKNSELAVSNQRGVALMLALSSVVFIMYLVNEVSYETNVEYIVYSQSVNRLKSYYAARSGMELSLLRIKIYTQVYSQLASTMKDQAGMMDMIWSMPWAWPPVMPPDLSAVDKDMIKKFTKESKMEAQYMATIEDEGSKIDLNDLNSASKPLIESTKTQLINIFTSKMQNDQDWARNNRDLRPEEVVNNIADWMTRSSQSLNGGSKSAGYKDLGAGFPPNRAFRSVGELRLVAGMTDDIYNLLESKVTVFGMKSINPNHVSAEIIESLDPAITPEIAKIVVARRDSPQLGGPYKDAQDFWSYVAAKGAQVNPEAEKKIPITVDNAMSFKIHTVGEYGKTSSEITAIVYDIQNVTRQLYKSLALQQQQQNQLNGVNNGNNNGTGTGTGNGSGNQSNNNNGNNTPPPPPPAPPAKGPPRIVYWSEK